MIGPLAGTVAAVIETNRDDLGGMSSDHHKATSHSARRHQADQTRIGLDKTGFLHPVNTMTPTDPQSADNSIEMGDVAHVAGVSQTDPTMDGADNPGLGKPQIERCSSLG